MLQSIRNMLRPFHSLKFFVKKSIESNISKTEILAHCIKNLERFKVPAKIEFVEDFPRTDYGKIKRFMLK